jgi:hypothetical protein
MGLKGQSPTILIIFTILTVIIVASTLGINWWFGERKTDTITGKAEMQSRIYAMNNALTAAKTYSETALDYSVYQAAYDYLHNGQEEIPEDQEMENTLSTMIKNNLDIYTAQNYDFLTEYHVSFPNFNVEVTTEPGIMSVNMKSEDNLNIHKTQESGETIHLEKNPEISTSYNINLGGLLAEGRNISTLASEGLKKAIQNEISLPAEASQAVEECGTAQDLESDCISLISGYSSKTGLETSLKTLIEDSINSRKTVWEHSDNFNISIEILDTQVQVLVEGDYSCGQANTLNCSFSYTAESTVKVSVKQKNAEIYPVFTGENVETVPLELIFLVREQQSQPEA